MFTPVYEIAHSVLKTCLCMGHRYFWTVETHLTQDPTKRARADAAILVMSRGFGCGCQPLNNCQNSLKFSVTTYAFTKMSLIFSPNKDLSSRRTSVVFQMMTRNSYLLQGQVDTFSVRTILFVFRARYNTVKTLCH